MWKKLRSLVGGDAKKEAEIAQAEAEASYRAAVQKSAEVRSLTSRIHEHGRVNHIGERVTAALRRA